MSCRPLAPGFLHWQGQLHGPPVLHEESALTRRPGDPDLAPCGPEKAPEHPLLRGPAVGHEPLVGVLQVAGRGVQLLVHLRVLLVHLPQQLHLLAQVLEERRRSRGARLRRPRCPPPCPPPRWLRPTEPLPLRRLGPSPGATQGSQDLPSGSAMHWDAQGARERLRVQFARLFTKAQVGCSQRGEEPQTVGGRVPPPDTPPPCRTDYGAPGPCQSLPPPRRLGAGPIFLNLSSHGRFLPATSPHPVTQEVPRV